MKIRTVNWNSANKRIVSAHPRSLTRERGGFTLIELMITISIFVVITGIVCSSFDAVVRSTDSTRRLVEELRLRQFLAHHIERNVSQAYLGWRAGAADREDNAREHELSEEIGIEAILMGENKRGANGPADTLSFFTTAPPLGFSGMPGFVKRVVYTVVDEAQDGESQAFDEYSEDSGRYRLEISETPVMTAMDAETFMAPKNASVQKDYADMAEKHDRQRASVVVPIRSMDILYFDGEEWVEDWDSTEEFRLPWCIHFRINFERNEEEIDAEQAEGIDPNEEPDFELFLNVPTGAGVLDEPPTVTLADQQPI